MTLQELVKHAKAHIKAEISPNDGAISLKWEEEDGKCFLVTIPKGTEVQRW